MASSNKIVRISMSELESRDNFTIKIYIMSDYNTPRRKHSSLFQRMEDEINKISKKLSAAKQIRQTHSRKATISHPIHSFFSAPLDTPQETVRRHKNMVMNSKQLTRKNNFLQDRTNLLQINDKGPARKLRFGSQYEDLQNSQLKKLLQENRQLEKQMKVMKLVCEEQAFKLGFLRAQSRQKYAHLEQQRNYLRQQQIYLSKLTQGYKLKVQKYKRWIGNQQSLELDIQDL